MRNFPYGIDTTLMILKGAMRKVDSNYICTRFNYSFQNSRTIGCRS